MQHRHGQLSVVFPLLHSIAISSQFEPRKLAWLADTHLSKPSRGLSVLTPRRPTAFFVQLDARTSCSASLTLFLSHTITNYAFFRFNRNNTRFDHKYERNHENTAFAWLQFRVVRHASHHSHWVFPPPFLPLRHSLSPSDATRPLGDPVSLQNTLPNF